MASFFERFLNDRMTFASLMEERSDGSVRYDNLVAFVVKPNPKPAPVAVEARVLEACDLNCRLPIVCRRFDEE